MSEVSAVPSSSGGPGRFSRSFFALVCAQVVSLLGDRIVSFALPLYVLGLTGSSSLFSVVTASALVPYVVLTPIGGVVADRVRRGRLMACLDLVLAAVCVGFLLLEGVCDLVALSAVAMIMLYAVQAFYIPTVQATVPGIVARDALVTATAVTNQVSSLAGLVGPFVGGMLFGYFGLEPILAIGAVAFVVSSAIVAGLVRPPAVRRADCAGEGRPQGVFAIVGGDVREGLAYLRANPFIVRVCLLAAMANFVMSAFVTVALPVVVTQILGLSDQLMGTAQAVASMGALVGGAVAAVRGSRLRFSRAPLFFLLASLTFVPLALAIYLGEQPGVAPIAAYAGVVACLFACMLSCQVFSIQCTSFVQLSTPDALLGKVISLVTAACMVATPAGQLVWGVAFDVFRGQAPVLALVVGVVSTLLALLTLRVFRGAPESGARQG